MKHAFINLIRQWCLAFLKKHPPESPEQMSVLLTILSYGSLINGTGASTNPLSQFPFPKQTGRGSEPGRGNNSGKLVVSPTFHMMAEHIAKPRTKSATKPRTTSSKPKSQRSTGTSSKK